MAAILPSRSVLKSRWLVIGFVLALSAFVALLSAPPVLAAGIEATDPITNEVGVELDADIVATYTAAISPTTVTTQTFAAQGMMSGLIEGAFSFDGGDAIVTLDPAGDFFAGEVVRVSATGGVSDTAGSPATAYQWQFMAGPVLSRCVDGFVNVTSAGLPGVYDSTGAWGDYDVEMTAYREASKPILADLARIGIHIEEFHRLPASEQSDIKAGICRTLAVVVDESVFEDIVELVRDKRQGEGRRYLARALGEIAGARALPILIELLDDEEVTSGALWALGELGLPEAHSEVERFRYHAEEQICNAAKEALAKIDKHLPEDMRAELAEKARIEAWQAWAKVLKKLRK